MRYWQVLTVLHLGALLQVHVSGDNGQSGEDRMVELEISLYMPDGSLVVSHVDGKPIRKFCSFPAEPYDEDYTDLVDEFLESIGITTTDGAASAVAVADMRTNLLNATKSAILQMAGNLFPVAGACPLALLPALSSHGAMRCPTQLLAAA